MMEENTVRNPAEEIAGEAVDNGAEIKDRFAEKYREARKTCRSAYERIREDLRQTNWNPYIRVKTTRRYELYRSENDSEPIDSFVLERSGGCNLRALMITAGILTVLHLTIGGCFKK